MKPGFSFAFEDCSSLHNVGLYDIILIIMSHPVYPEGRRHFFSLCFLRGKQQMYNKDDIV